MLSVDLDRDGDQDLVVIKDQAPSRVYLNDGRGNYSELANALAGLSVAAQAVAAADLTGDGLLDLLVGVDGAPSRLLRGDGRGRFVDDSLRTRLIGRVTDVAAVDVNGDGRVDLLVAVRDGPNQVLLASPGFTYLGAPILLDEGMVEDSRAILGLDVDLDEDLDVLVGNFQSPARLSLNWRTQLAFRGQVAPFKRTVLDLKAGPQHQLMVLMLAFGPIPPPTSIPSPFGHYHLGPFPLVLTAGVFGNGSLLSLPLAIPGPAPFDIHFQALYADASLALLQLSNRDQALATDGF
jgi:hypothetical protein